MAKTLTTSKQLISQKVIGTVNGYNVYLRQYAWETDLDPITNTSLISYNGFIYYDAPSSQYTFYTNNGVTSAVSGLISYNESLPGTITFVGGQEYLIIAKAISVSHNSDGSKSGTLKLDATIANWFSGSTSETVNCQTIPRYATCSQSLNNREETTVKMNWSSDSTCDYLWYSKDNGANWIAVGSVNGTSGTYTISGLSANTSYNIKTRVRRKDSQLTTDSSALSVATYQFPYITNISNSALTIGNQQTVSLYNPLKRNVTVYMKKDSTSGTTLYSGTTTGTSITFTPDASTLYSTIPNSTKSNAVYYCTYSSQTITTKSGTYSIDVNQCKPTFSNFEYSTNLSELTNNSNTIIDSKTTTTFVISSANKAVAKNGASISKYRIECGSQSANIDYSNNDISGAIANCNSNILKVTAIDSRGLETTVSKTVGNYINYTRPIIMSSVAARKDGVEAETHLSLNINFFNGDFGNGINKITSLKYRVLTGSSWSEYFTIDLSNISYLNNTALLEDYLVHANGSSSGFAVGTSYGIQVMLSDGLDTYTLETIYSDVITVTDGKVALSVLKNSNGDYCFGINGMPKEEYQETVYGNKFIDKVLTVGDIECKNLSSSNRIGWKQKMTYATFNSNILKYQAIASNWSGLNFILSEDLIVGETYTVSFKNTSNLGIHVNITRTNTGWQSDWDNSYISSQYVSANSRFSYTFTANTSLAGIFFTASTNSNADTEERVITEIQIEKGRIVTSWSPNKNFSNQKIYSFKEHEIGIYIEPDGTKKILYSQTFRINMPNGKTSRHNNYSTGIDTAICRNIYGTMYVNNNQFGLPLHNLINNETCLIATQNYCSILSVELNCDFSLYYADITLEYTKI